MSNLRDEMKSLVQGIATSAHVRQTAVAEGKRQTARMLRTFRRQRVAMAHALASNHAAERVARTGSVLALRGEARAIQDLARREQSRMRHVLRRELAQSTASVAKVVAVLRSGFAQTRVDNANARRQMAMQQRIGLTKSRVSRSHEVAELVKGFHQSHRTMSRQLAEGLAKSTQSTKAQIAGLSEWFNAARPRVLQDVPPRSEMSTHMAAPGHMATAKDADRPAHFLPAHAEPQQQEQEQEQEHEALRVRTAGGKPAHANSRTSGNPTKR